MKKIVVILMALIATNIFAFSVSGRTIDVDGLPISGVVVSAEKYVVVSDVDGIFHLSNIKEADRIFFHKIGYEDKYLFASFISMRVILEQNIIEVEGFRVSEAKLQEATITSSDKLVISNIDNNASDAAELLSGYADIKIKGSELLGNKRTISLGGNKAKHTLIMLDGIALNMNGEDFDISSIPINIIDKIEIIRNNATAIGGAGALGGIVNIITKTKLDYNASEKKRFLATISSSIKLGSFDLLKAQTQFSLSTPNIQAFTMYSNSSAENNFTYYDLITESEKIRKNNSSEIIDGSIMVATKMNIVNLKYNLLYQDYYKQLPGAVGTLQMFDQCHKSGVNTKQHLNFSFTEKAITFQADFYLNSDDSNYDNSESTLGGMQKNSTIFSKKGGKVTTKYNWLNLLNLKIAGEFDRQDYKYESNSILDSIIDKRMDNYAIISSAELEWNFYPVNYKVVCNLREDIPQKNSEIDFDSEMSYRAEAVAEYQNWFDVMIGGGVGNSYQLPSFYDLNWMEGYQAVGNPDLLPEYSKGWNIFYQFKVAKSYLKLRYNYNEIDNLIKWYKSLYYWKPANIGKAEISSFEVQTEIHPFSWMITNFSWQRNFAYNKSITADGYQTNAYNKNLIYTPRSQVELGITIPINNFNLTAKYSRTGKQWTTEDNLRAPLDSYKLLDSKLNYVYSKDKWELSGFVGINNVLNEEYEITDMMPKPGRNWISGIDLEIKF